MPELEGRDSYLGSFPPRRGRGGPGGPTWMPVLGLRQSWESLPDAHPGDVEVLGSPPECPSQGCSSPGGPTRMPVPGAQRSWGPRPDAHPGDAEVLGVPPRCPSQGHGGPVGPTRMLVPVAWWSWGPCPDTCPGMLVPRVLPLSTCTQPYAPCPARLWGPFLCCPPPVVTPLPVSAATCACHTVCTSASSPPTQSSHHKCPAVDTLPLGTRDQLLWAVLY